MIKPTDRTLQLPYPPSMNTYWRRRGHQMFITPKGQAFRADVVAIVENTNEPIAGPVCVEIKVYPPDRRRRDLDNILKPLLDALEHGGVYDNDSQIVRLVAERCDVVAGGETWVRVTEVENERS